MLAKISDAIEDGDGGIDDLILPTAVKVQHPIFPVSDELDDLKDDCLEELGRPKVFSLFHLTPLVLDHHFTKISLREEASDELLGSLEEVPDG